MDLTQSRHLRALYLKMIGHAHDPYIYLQWSGSPVGTEMREGEKDRKGEEKGREGKGVRTEKGELREEEEKPNGAP